MEKFSEQSLTQAVIDQLANCQDERLKALLTSLVQHLHAFVRENQVSLAEWRAAIDFLTQTGQMSDAKRQEFILLSDVLGVSMLVDALNHPTTGLATESSVLGPFYVEGAPELPSGSQIASEGTGGEVVTVSGAVRDTASRPIAGALLDVWQTAPSGLYDIQVPDGGMNLRGKFLTDAEGSYSFHTVKPVSYPIPNDGPVGKLLETIDRHPYRPAHLHFIVSAPGYEALTTQLFVAGDPYLGSDAVFGVKPSLVVDFAKGGADGSTVTYDFILTATSSERAALSASTA
jgi:protocatechuate 3,4-dioxygenase beta subunit